MDEDLKLKAQIRARLNIAFVLLGEAAELDESLFPELEPIATQLKELCAKYE